MWQIQKYPKNKPSQIEFSWVSHATFGRVLSSGRSRVAWDEAPIIIVAAVPVGVNVGVNCGDSSHQSADTGVDIYQATLADNFWGMDRELG